MQLFIAHLPSLRSLCVPGFRMLNTGKHGRLVSIGPQINYFQLKTINSTEWLTYRHSFSTSKVLIRRYTLTNNGVTGVSSNCNTKKELCGGNGVCFPHIRLLCHADA